MDSLLRDVKFSARSLLKRRGLTIIAIVTLAIGIGSNSAIFSAVNALLLNPLPLSDVDRVVAIWESQPARGAARIDASLANFLDWKSQNQTFEQMGLSRSWSTNITGGDSPERIQGFLVSANFLDVIGTAPILGRSFTADEDQPGKDPVVILSYDLWQRRFGADTNIIGKTITLNAVSRTVVGVLPRGLNFPRAAEVIAPITITPEMATNRKLRNYEIVGRLKQNVSLAQASGDLATIAARLQNEHPATNTGWGVAVYPIVDDVVRTHKSAILVLMATVGFVLLIVCANIANLMLAKAAGRQKEIALRSALGASRWQIVRQLLTESMILALVGGFFGILIAYWGVDLLRTLNPGQASKFAPGWDRFSVNPTVLGFNLLLSLCSGVLFGLAPAWQISKTDLNQGLKKGSRETSSGSHRLRSLLVISELALSVMLLVSAGLLLRSFLTLLKTDAGFNHQNVMTMSLALPAAKYKDNTEKVAFYDELLQRVRSLPGVASAGAISHLPLGGRNSSNPFLIEGLPNPPAGQENVGRQRSCTPDYFRAMEIPVLRGRPFTDQDRSGSTPVVIVNETLAQRFWPDGDALGKRMRVAGPPDEFPWMEVVGVVKDVKHELDVPTTPDYYRPQAQDGWSSMVMVARTTVEPMSLASAMREQVWAVDKDQPVFDVRTMEQVRDISVALYSFSSVSLGIFAGIALLLAAMGIYGVMSYVVTLRTQEIGIRMALGARNADVLTLVVRNGMRLAVVGVIVGLAAAFGTSRLLVSLLFGVTPTDLLTFGSVTAVLLFVAFIATFIPARRATKVDPLVALRYE